ncbi:MAG: hypothetical protein RLN90_09675 [Balneolaceae bacterium]
MKTLKKVTAWYCWDRASLNWQFNHIEDGWNEDVKPTPKFESQKEWKNESWFKIEKWEDMETRTVINTPKANALLRAKTHKVAS